MDSSKIKNLLKNKKVIYSLIGVIALLIIAYIWYVASGAQAMNKANSIVKNNGLEPFATVHIDKKEKGIGIELNQDGLTEMSNEIQTAVENGEYKNDFYTEVKALGVAKQVSQNQTFGPDWHVKVYSENNGKRRNYYEFKDGTELYRFQDKDPEYQELVTGDKIISWGKYLGKKAVDRFVSGE